MFTASSLLGGTDNPGACKTVRIFYAHLIFSVCLVNDYEMVMEEKTKIGATKSKSG